MTGVQPGVRMPLGSRWRAYFCVADDDRVAGVVAAVELHDVVDAAAEQVGRLALALVAPLGADDGDRGHRRWLLRTDGRYSAEPGHRLPGHGPLSPLVSAMDPLLVITNSDAGTADEESLRRRPRRAARARLGRGAATVQPGRARRRRCTGPARAGSSSPGGDGSLHAVVAALLPAPRPQGRRARADPPLGTGNDFARGNEHPARHRGGGAQVARVRRRRARWTWSSTRSARSSSTTCTSAPAPRPAAAARAGRSGCTPSASARSTSASSATRSAPRWPP